jgi:hypothetical protein
MDFKDKIPGLGNNLGNKKKHGNEKLVLLGKMEKTGKILNFCVEFNFMNSL